jgi:light-regulated signal transduction histidine kinase (bacteriophytochrome)
MSREPVDLSAMAREIAAELRRQEPSRRVSFVIADGLRVEGDPHLLHQVLENLLANAWKFTSRRAEAEIQVRGEERDGEVVCSVRDDGVGFDMAFAKNLFGAFQRLHAMRDFPGNGVGLATVQRIVHRHGGRVWAEAVPDRGATFSFSLPRAGRAEVP